MTGSFREGNMLGSRAQKIVLVDDNTDLTLTAKIYLRMQGYDVWVADTGAKGVALIKEVRPDVVFCDIGMPGMNGYQVAKAIRADASLGHVRLLAMTAFGRDEDIAKAVAAGFERHLLKPTPLQDLVTTIERGATLVTVS
jgi:CheY-like chemotaxis protein